MIGVDGRLDAAAVGTGGPLVTGRNAGRAGATGADDAGVPADQRNPLARTTPDSSGSPGPADADPSHTDRIFGTTRSTQVVTPAADTTS